MKEIPARILQELQPWIDSVVLIVMAMEPVMKTTFGMVMLASGLTPIVMDTETTAMAQMATCPREAGTAFRGTNKVAQIQILMAMRT